MNFILKSKDNIFPIQSSSQIQYLAKNHTKRIFNFFHDSFEPLQRYKEKTNEHSTFGRPASRWRFWARLYFYLYLGNGTKESTRKAHNRWFLLWCLPYSLKAWEGFKLGRIQIRLSGSIKIDYFPTDQIISIMAGSLPDLAFSDRVSFIKIDDFITTIIVKK